MRYAIIGALALIAGPALADVETREAQGSVAEAMDRLEAAVEDAGATVFARIDHGGGAEDAGLELADSQLLVFGNPELGTPVMQDDMVAGLYLPLKMLVYADEDGQTHVAWEEIEDTFDDLDVDDDMEAFETMETAMDSFAEAAAGGN